MKRTHPHTDVHSIKLGTDVSTGLVAHSKQHARNQSKTHTVDHKIRWKQELTQKACTKKPGHRKHTHSASVWWNFLFLKSPNRHNRLSRLFSSRFGYLTCTPVSLHLAPYLHTCFLTFSKAVLIHTAKQSTITKSGNTTKTMYDKDRHAPQPTVLHKNAGTTDARGWLLQCVYMLYINKK